MCLQAKQDVLAAKQSMFSRHASTEKALREHKEQLAAAREELASKEGLHQTMKANAANLRAQISSLKVPVLPSARMPVRPAALSTYVDPENTDFCFNSVDSWDPIHPWQRQLLSGRLASQAVGASAGMPGWAGAG